MSSTTAKKQTGDCCDRIVDVATDLFFKQGYRATGINQIIEESGVAKATFYSHFKSKDELCKCYLENLAKGEMLNVDGLIAAANGPVERYLAPIRSLEPWLAATHFRGCPFVNIASEVPDPDSPLRKVGMDVYADMGKKIEGLCHELVAAPSGDYRHLDARTLATNYQLIFAGAVSLAELYHDVKPARLAVEAVRKLID